jgi:hypothetical protein
MTQNLFSNLHEIIIQSLTVCSSIAGFSQAEWANNHIFHDYNGKFIRGMNRGRMPFVYFQRNSSNYRQENMSSTVGGTVTTTWTITFIAGAPSRANDHPSETLLYALATTFLSDIRQNWVFRQGSDEIGDVRQMPFGYALEIKLIVDNTYDQLSR